MVDVLASQSRLQPPTHEEPPLEADIHNSNVTADLWKLEWLQGLLESLWNTKAFPTVLPKVFVYLGEELQHVAYPEAVREQALKSLFKVC